MLTFVPLQKRNTRPIQFSAVTTDKVSDKLFERILLFANISIKNGIDALVIETKYLIIEVFRFACLINIIS